VIGQPAIANQVTFVVRVLAAVNLDDEPSLTANKIDDIRTDWFLPHTLEDI
jgi:50S ribosomal subunit-associated GTPase HflX